MKDKWTMPKMKLVEEFKTCQCEVKVYDTGFEVDFYHIYMIKSHRSKSGKVNTRFGTKSQIKGIIKTYNKEKRFTL